MPACRKVWITRALPGAAATAERVRALGFEAVVAPLLAVREIAAEIDLAGVAALAFTSANAVRAFAARSAMRDLEVFAVGEATARAVRAAGFGTVHSADGDVAALARLIAAHRPARVLHPGGRDRAGDLAGLLRPHGVEVRAVTLYETAPTALAAPPDAAFVLVHSAKAARELAALLKRSPAPHLAALCLSPTLAQPLAHARLAAVASAPAPTEAALLALLANGR